MNLIEKAKRSFRLYFNLAQSRNLKLELIPGEILEGTVLECLDQSKILVRLKDFDLTADCFSNLEKGDRILVRVNELEPKIVLNLIFKKNDRSEAIEVKI